MALEAIYEKGTLKLSEQIEIEDGTKVQVIIIPEDFNSAENQPFSLLQEIAQLPLEGKTDDFSGQDHDRILYSE
jgi:predicted DNA-binding antitoxin AbrB/MazE fold protein